MASSASEGLYSHISFDIMKAYLLPFFTIFQSFIYEFILAVVGLHCCTWAFSSCGKWGLLFVAVYGLIAVASLVEHGL